MTATETCFDTPRQATWTDAPAMQRRVEVLIGRLITDEAFRQFVLCDPLTTLQLADEWGLELSDDQIHALIATDPHLWDVIASELDLRLQQALTPLN